MSSNNIPQSEESQEEVKLELKGIGVTHFWGRDAEKVAELDQQGKLKWRPIPEEEQREMVETMRRRKRLLRLVNPSLDALKRVSNLDDNSAKTCLYWAIGTHGLDELRLYPILTLLGEPGSGKSSIMKLMEQIVNNPVWFSTTPTRATLRDKLGKNTTAFVEEGDNIEEEIVRNRYSRETGKASFKKALPKGGWKDIEVDFFGATVLHRRMPFKDLATKSRSIIIRTKYKAGDYVMTQLNERDNLRQIWQESKQNWHPDTGRGIDVWKPLLAVAATLGDPNWMRFCHKEIEEAGETLKFGAGFEPEQAVVCALIAKSNEGKMVSLSGIRDWLKREYNWQPTAWALGDKIRSLGFEVKTSHGERKVKTNTQLLIEVANKLGIEDEALLPLKEQVNLSVDELQD